MEYKLRETVNRYNEDVEYFNKDVYDKEWFFDKVKEGIVEKTNDYYKEGANKEAIASELSRLYNMYYYIKSTKDIDRMYLLDEELDKLPPTYVIDEKPVRFDVNDELLNGIDVSQGLTIEEANELLKWTANNTRDNMNIDEKNYNPTREVYDNCTLSGLCGFSRFSALYPLEKMGLHVTVNNMAHFGAPAHAYGSVIIPIRENDEIVNKRFLVDLTYRQFFEIKENIVSRYINSHPTVGFFVKNDSDEINFSKELLKNGFVEATEENLKKYFKPFVMQLLSLDKTDSIDEVMANIDLIDVLENHQQDYDYDEEEFINWGLNLSIDGNMTK